MLSRAALPDAYLDGRETPLRSSSPNARASALSLFLTDPRDAFILWEILGGTSCSFFFFASLFSILFGRLPFLLFFLSHPRRPLNLSRLFFSFVWGFLSVPFPGLAPSIYETGSIAW